MRALALWRMVMVSAIAVNVICVAGDLHYGNPVHRTNIAGVALCAGGLLWKGPR